MPHFIIILILNLNLIITGISSSKTLDNNHRRRIKCGWWHHRKNTFWRFDQRWYNHHRQTSTQFWICHRFERGWKYPQQTSGKNVWQLQCPNGFKKHGDEFIQIYTLEFSGSIFRARIDIPQQTILPLASIPAKSAFQMFWYPGLSQMYAKNDPCVIQD